MLRRNEKISRLMVTATLNSLIYAMWLHNEPKDGKMTNDELMGIYTDTYTNNKDRFQSKFKPTNDALTNFGKVRVALQIGQDLNYRTFDTIKSTYDMANAVFKIISVWIDIHRIRHATHEQDPKEWGFENCRWITDDDLKGSLDITLDLPHITGMEFNSVIELAGGHHADKSSSTSAFCICHAEEAEFTKLDRVPVNTAHVVLLPGSFFDIFPQERLLKMSEESENGGFKFRSEVESMELEIIGDVFIGYVAHEINHIMESFYLVKDLAGSDSPVDTGLAVPEDYESENEYTTENSSEWRSTMFASLFSGNFEHRVNSHRAYLKRIDVKGGDDEFCHAVELVRNKLTEQNEGI